MGISVVVLTYDSKKTLTQFVMKYSITYPMLSDPESRVIKQFGILNSTMDVGSKYHGVPYPGVFLVDDKGIIREKFAEENYRDRPLLEDVMSSAAALVN